MTGAFHGDPAIRDRAIARLRTALAEGRLHYQPQWDGNAGDGFGVIAESDDIAVFADRMGFPQSVALVLSDCFHGYRPVERAAEAVEQWLLATPPGADLSRVAGAIILELLQDETLMEAVVAEPAIESARRAVVALHQREQSGDAPTRQEWKGARALALAATDVAEDKVAVRAGRAIEAAAWPGNTRTVLSEVNTCLNLVWLAVGMDAIGWSDADESRAFHVMRDWDENPATPESEKLKRGDLADACRVLGFADPALARGFKARNAVMDKLDMRRPSVAEMIRERLATAPVPGSPSSDCR